MDLYFNGMMDSNFGTLGNWWEEAGFYTPASAVPGPGDHAHIYSNLTSDADRTVGDMTFHDAHNFDNGGGKITATGTITFYGGSNNHELVANSFYFGEH